MGLTSLPRATLADRVAAQLRAQITSGEWPVGSRIPTEPELVERLGVARNTIREAVRSLAHNGLLDIRQGAGTYVIATSELSGVMHRRFTEADSRDVAEVRSILESSAARLAATRRTEQDLAQLDSCLERRAAAWAADDTEAFVTADTSLHMAVVAAAHNDVLTELYADLGAILRDWLRDDLGTQPAAEDPMDHTRLIDAIRTGDADRAATEAASYPSRCTPPRPEARDGNASGTD